MRVVPSANVLVFALTLFPMGCATTRASRLTNAASLQTAPDAVILVKGMT
jgi:hypothetical protein